MKDLLLNKDSFDAFVKTYDNPNEKLSSKPNSYPCIIVWTKDYSCPELLGDYYIACEYVYLTDFES